jgi:type IX secretion system PorP/SprF family membrane protein
MKTILIFSILVSIAVTGKAQDHSFMQFNAVPMYYNPGYAGSVESPRLAMSYNLLTPKNSSYSYLSYDQAIKRLHAGVGLEMHTDYLGNFNKAQPYSKVFYCGFSYAAKFNIGNKLAISPAVKIGYRKNELFYGEHGAFYNSQKILQTQNADIALGVVFNTEKLHFGFAVDHINRPDISTFNYYDRVPLDRKYTGQLGYTFQKYKGANFSVTTGLLFQKQGDEGRLTFNGSARYKFAVVGGSVSLGNTGWQYNVLAGYYSRKCIIGYSIEPLINSSHFKNEYSHELTLRYIFSPPKEEKGIDSKPAKKHRIFKNRKRILQN